MSNPQPDIEIYVKTKDEEKIKNWLASLFPQDITLSKNGSLLSAKLQKDDQIIPVNIMLNAQGGFSSIWFDSPLTHWEDDLSCAKQFVKDVGIMARCIKSSWEEGETEDPDCWLQVGKSETKEIIWK